VCTALSCPVLPRPVLCCAALQVTWAQLSTLPRRNPAGGGPPPPMPRGFTVSYACIPTSATPAEVAATFERFGIVLQVRARDMLCHNKHR
jgi:hypothetical protein